LSGKKTLALLFEEKKQIEGIDIPSIFGEERSCFTS
jgi:hypothetical protein